MSECMQTSIILSPSYENKTHYPLALNETRHNFSTFSNMAKIFSSFRSGNLRVEGESIPMNCVSLPFLCRVVYLHEKPGYSNQVNSSARNIHILYIAQDRVQESEWVPPILKLEIYVCSSHTNASRQLYQHVTVGKEFIFWLINWIKYEPVTRSYTIHISMTSNWAEKVQKSNNGIPTESI